MNNKGFITSTLLYGMLVLFLTLILSILAIFSNRKLSTDKLKENVLQRLQEQFQYTYTGDVQEFNVPETGKYKIELWGASGGSFASNVAGNGAYTEGIILLQKNDTFYIYVGSKGDANTSLTNTGGYNGGGYSGNNPGANSSGGGGATDFRLLNGAWNNVSSLNSRIMVAAGGGGTATSSNSTGGGGGSLIGIEDTISTYGGKNYCGGTAPTQIMAGTSAAFGYASQSIIAGWGGGGGGGYYGGGKGCGRGGSGGSSYISGHIGCVAITSNTNNNPKSGCITGTINIDCSYHYSNYKFTNTTMMAGNESMPRHNSNATMTGNVGDGFAKITYIS